MRRADRNVETNIEPVNVIEISTPNARKDRSAESRAYYLANRDKILTRGKARARARTPEEKETRNARARARRALNPEKHREQVKRSHIKHPESIKRAQKKFFEANPNYMKEWETENRPRRAKLAKEWRAANPGKCAAYKQNRVAIKLQAMPPWVDKDAIEAFYVESRRLTILTGIKHNVDHYWSLQGVGYVGLHVPWNLRVITQRENDSKCNKRPDEFYATYSRGQ